MRRREFIAGLGAAGGYAAVPRLTLAQQGTGMRRVAMLTNQDEPPQNTLLATFQNELAMRGWVAGRNLQIDVRYGRGDVDRMRANAAELVGLAPDVIVANGAPMVTIVQQQTQTIPIVIAFAGDVFAYGLVKNLAHPEGNTTGVTNLFAPIAGKWVELLKEAVPRVERVGYIAFRARGVLPALGGAGKGIAGSRLTDDRYTFQQRCGPDARHRCLRGRAKRWTCGHCCNPQLLGNDQHSGDPIWAADHLW
jgi:ABC transporter substrate binding protein